jgi:hypothetical protein
MHRGRVIPFVSSDVWLFLSVANASRRRGASLDNVIAMGDAINRDIFTPQQLRTGSAKLIAASLMEIDAERFRLTDEGRALYRRCRGGGLRSEWSALERELDVSNAPVDEARWPYPQMTDEVVQQAYERYRKRFENGLRFWRRRR